MTTLHTPHFQLNSVIPASYTHSLVFIDTAVENYQSLVNGVISHTEVFVIGVQPGYVQNGTRCKVLL
ncbi:hypothetical protein, partial [uncultured Nostoc sp.]|uniref:hypothetical protein n=1 Tax=uncultured Nostoc sp. TaxID=340711 RepID=UPI0035C9E7B3